MEPTSSWILVGSVPAELLRERLVLLFSVCAPNHTSFPAFLPSPRMALRTPAPFQPWGRWLLSKWPPLGLNWGWMGPIQAHAPQSPVTLVAPTPGTA